jgi:hypothetical protein
VGGVAGDAAGARGPGGGAQQSQREDGAAVRVDAAGGVQHAGLGRDAQCGQRREFGAGRTLRRHAHEEMAQREQAAQEGAGVHVAVAAGIGERHEARLGLQRELVVQRPDGGAAQRGVERTPRQRTRARRRLRIEGRRIRRHVRAPPAPRRAGA